MKNYPRRKRINSPFTLVELLVVMAIMALLLYIAMPAFEKMVKGQGSELAARNIYNYLSLSRGYAITNRQYVAVLFPQKDYPTSIGNSELNARHLNSSYRACIINSSKEFVRWIPGDNWQFLPAGTIILETDTDKGFSDPPANGTITKISKVNFSDIGGNSNVSDVAAVLFKPTGCSEYRIYVVIGEGKYDGSNLIITNKNPNAYTAVTIDQFTGRVSYGTD